MSATTRIRSIDRDRPDVALLDQAARVIRSGGLVAFATETVYGLGADATNPEAVARIFTAKGRPATNPLIAHASDRAMARRCVSDWPDAAEALARAFWPGPLTLILPRSGIIPDIVTAGRETVAVRVPATEVARRLIVLSDRPIAAPSANRSTGISPTLARHVAADLGDRVDLILDSGPTTEGLESTILDLTASEPRILRPGPITAARIETVLGLPVHDATGHAATPDDGPMASPGRMAVHYAPRTDSVRVESAAVLTDFPWTTAAVLVVVGTHELPPLPPTIRRFDLPEPVIAARGLYALLHECDALRVEQIVVVMPPDRPEWHALRDRLRRATRPAGDRL